MAGLDDIFKDNNKAPGRRFPADIPVKRVIDLKEKGLSNNQIVQSLQREGYKSSQILDAMSQAKIKGTIQSTQLEEDTMVENPMNENTGGLPSGQMQPPQQSQENFSAPEGDYPMADTSISDERVQEIAEAIIEEKWEEVVENMNRVIEWKDKVERTITSLQQQVSDLKENFDRLHTGVLSKIGEYDKHVQDVGVEVKALENVFKKILPGFVENVNKLSDVADTIKKGSKKKK